MYPIFFCRGQLYSRYSHSEWKQSNHHNFSLSEQERALGERLRSDAFQAVKKTDNPNQEPADEQHQAAR